MKVRMDFVSNSSSSSFVVACKKQHLDAIIKDLAKACSNRKNEFHDKSLEKRNRLALDFCLSRYCLAFLGKLVLSTKKKIYNLSYFEKIYSKRIYDKDAAVNQWNRYKEYLKSIKTSSHDVDPWIKDEYGMDEYDPMSDTAVHYEKTEAYDIVVTNGVMEYNFYRGLFNNDDLNDVKNRVDNIVKIAKAATTAKHKNTSPFYPVEIYQITKDTIDNTRDLINAGYTIGLEDWQDLDVLDAKIATGDTLFYVRIAHSGDGYGDFYIFCEDGADGLDGVSGIEILASECI